MPLKSADTDKIAAAIHYAADAVTEAARRLEPRTPEPESPPAPASRLCRDCRHCRPKTHFFVFKSYEFARCARPSSSESSLLVGGEGGYHCSSERGGGISWYCGPAAQFFEPR